MSLTLFFPDTTTTRDINKAQITPPQRYQNALYVRLRQMALEGTEIEGWSPVHFKEYL
ncbi:hypothetical protein ACNKHT_17305 [Shigella flexneri]